MTDTLGLARNIDEAACLETLSDMVRHKSYSETPGERALADHLVAVMRDMGLEAELGVVEGERMNAIGRWRGSGGGKSLMFNGHIDTNRVSEGWTVDPWGGLVDEDFIYGIGVSNMKPKRENDTMGNNIRSSSRPKALAPSIPMPPLADAMDAVHLSVDRFCLLAGVEALAEMMEEDATTVCGARHRRHGDRRGYRWGRTHSEIGYHGGKVKVARPRVRDRAGKEVSLESWQALRDGNLLLEWALNLMVLNVSTRKYHRAVRLPEGDLAKARGDGTSKSAVSRRFVALSRKKMKAWLASDLSELDLLVIQIDGLHVGDHVLMVAIGVDGNGDKSGDAASLCAVKTLIDAGVKPKGDVVLTYVVGELQGGVATMAAIRDSVKADNFINSEPTDLQAVTMHAAAFVFRIELEGVTRHLSKRAFVFKRR